MYHLYQTEGIVLKSVPTGEGSSYFYIFTKDLGLLVATAKSVREERSKLRYGLQPFSISNISLVRGKESWRITNATLSSSLFRRLRHQQETLALFSRIFAFLCRLVPPEEARFLETCDANPALCDDAELCLLIRMLSPLGYLAGREELSPFVSDSLVWSEGTLKSLRGVRRLALAETNRALRASHL